jgi:spermidine/putrescine ABC transporter ATP-binding subunit
MPMPEPVAELELVGVRKRFAATMAVDGVSFRLGKGEFLSLLGPSGCGKTTTLRMIAGFEHPDEGRVMYRGRDITDDPPYRRDAGLVFQNYALFPHMSVGDNVAFGLRMRRAGKHVIRERVAWALDLVHLSGYEHRRPHELSGGQQQRVAVARVLAAGASLLLFDEPFSNLDAKLRKEMQGELRDLQQRLGIAVVHVTHDQEEAISMSDRLIIMNQGRVVQEGSPSQVYRAPGSEFVAEFMGQCNRLAAHVVEPHHDLARGCLALEVGGHMEVARTELGQVRGRVSVLIRPEHIELAPSGTIRDRSNVLAGVVRRSVYRGSTTTVHVRLNELTEVIVDVSNPSEGLPAYTPGTPVDLAVPVSAIRVLPD